MEDILDRGELPDDFAAWAAHQNNAAASRDAEALALANVRTYAAGRCWALFTSRAPQLLTHLDGQLTELVEQSRPAAAILDGLEDAAEVLRAGTDAAAAFAELDERWKTYMKIRSAQSRIVREVFDVVLTGNCHSDHCTDPAANDLNFRDLDRIFPDWRLHKGTKQTITVGRIGVYADSIAAPWPQSGPLQLSWFINRAANFWVPTAAQLTALHTERHRPTPADVPKRNGPGPEQKRRALTQTGVHIV